MATPEKNTDAVYDASTLGTPKMLVLGLQHLFAMFGATVLVPAITGLNVSTTLLFAGLGTLLFHLITGRKVPAFLGSSFAFLGAYGLVTASGQDIPLTYSCFGVAWRVLYIWFWRSSSSSSARRKSCASSRRWSQAPSSSVSACLWPVPPSITAAATGGSPWSRSWASSAASIQA